MVKSLLEDFLRTGGRQKIYWKASSTLEGGEKFTGRLPPHWRMVKSLLEGFLRTGGRQKVYWKASSALEGGKKFTGRLPPVRRILYMSTLAKNAFFVKKTINIFYDL
jgi:hypothetical protein